LYKHKLTGFNWLFEHFFLLVIISLLLITTVKAEPENTVSQGGQYTANTYGGIGILQNPTARFSDDGEFAFGISHETPWNRLYGRMQFLPWLEAVIRYTEGEYKPYYPGNPQTFKDKGIDVKIKLFNETDIFPQVALGLLDLGGTGLDSSEYIVASKQISNFDFTLGVGWGMLAGRSHLDNPLKLLSNKFESRSYAFGGSKGPGGGGTFSIGNFFSGEKIAFFGGLEYLSPVSNLKYSLEYDSKSYEALVGKETKFDATGNIFEVDSPFNFGITYQFKPSERDMVNLKLGYVRGNTIYANAYVNTNLNFEPKNRYRPPWGTLKVQTVESINDYDEESLRKLTDLISWQLANVGFTTHQIIFDDTEAIVEISQSRFFDTMEAINLASAILANNVPKDIETITVVNNDFGMQTLSASISYEDLYGIVGKGEKIEQYIYLQEERTDFDTIDLSIPNDYQVYENENLYPNFYWSIKPQLKGTLQHQVKFYFWQLELMLASEYAIRKGLFLTSRIGINIDNNYEQYTWSSTDGELEHVRQNRRLYLQEGQTGVRKLALDYAVDFSRNLKGKFEAGILEWMYGGIGGEVIYMPDHRDWALGLDVYWVKQRDYDQKFSFLDYETTTGFITYYKDLPFYNFRLKTSYGKFLAKDVGFHFDLSRKFKTGSTVGAGFALTDCDAECVGEGSFSKWIYFTLPMNLFYQNSHTREVTGYSWAPLTKDAGARLAAGGLYGLMINASDEVDTLRRKQWSIGKIFSGFSTSPKKRQ
jgi:hypothetical protein